MNKIENNMYYQANIKTSRNKDINFLQLSYGNFVSLDDYILLEKENKQLKEKLDCDLKWAFKCDELTKENQKLKEAINKAIDEIETGYFIDGDEKYSYLETWFGVDILLNILKEVE